ncbi:MAG: radical SAM protein [Deltaproteobacteria bacterium]|nr:radical SAM protein [Deltaproteobacteria bacterium]
MRILLLYPPPWKIPAPGEAPDISGEGPYEGWTSQIQFGQDELRMPYGLMSLAAQAKRSGYKVTLLNLYLFAWRDIEQLMKKLPAELYGLSCFTHNRRGAMSLATLIRRLYPQAFIVMGGPHATALPKEMLEHCEALDGIVIGEGEATFMELIHRLENGHTAQGLAGMAYRDSNGVEMGPERKRIKDLDSLASPYDYYNGDVIISTRGCPGKCTFCASPVLWKGSIRFHSSNYVLDMFEKMVNIHGRKIIAIKDDTFTANPERVLEICHGIIRRNLKVIWSCDTRIDALNEEVLCAMRRAGCQRISFGVESASPDILRSIKKRTTPQQVLSATEMARVFGFQIRYYMIAGNRNETADTLQASFDFIERAKPNQFIFYFLMIFPGTKEFELVQRKGLINKEVFFTKNWPYFAYPLPREMSPKMRKLINRIYENPCVLNYWDYSIEDRKNILRLFPDLSTAHFDLAAAYYASGNSRQAKRHIGKAIRKGYPVVATAYNNLAVISITQGKVTAAKAMLEKAKRVGVQPMVESNLRRLNEFLNTSPARKSSYPQLSVNFDFRMETEFSQPVAPGPIRLVD